MPRKRAGRTPELEAFLAIQGGVVAMLHEIRGIVEAAGLKVDPNLPPLPQSTLPQDEEAALDAALVAQGRREVEELMSGDVKVGEWAKSGTGRQT